MGSLAARRWFAIAALAGLVLAACSGCVNPFQPATPELPSGSGPPEDFSDWNAVLRTISIALIAGANGDVAYFDAFADSTKPSDFAYRQFYPREVLLAAQAASEPYPDPWTKDNERFVFNYLINLRPNAPTYALSWIPDPDSPNDDTLSTDTVYIHRRYILTVPSTDPTAGNDTLMAGFADLSLRQSSGRWAIFRWVDRVDPSFGYPSPRRQAEAFPWSRRRILSQVKPT